MVATTKRGHSMFQALEARWDTMLMKQADLLLCHACKPQSQPHKGAWPAPCSDQELGYYSDHVS